MDQQKSCSLKLAPKNRRSKEACMFFSLIFFFAPFSISYIPHNYVIQQAVHMPFRKLIPPFTLTGVFVVILR